MPQSEILWLCAMLAAVGCDRGGKTMKDDPKAETAAVETAIKNGDEPALRALLAEDPSRASRPLTDGILPVLLAVYHRKPGLLALLREHAGPLEWFSAAAVGDTKRLTALRTAKPELVNALSSDGNTALHLAAFFRHSDAVEYLITAGADPDAIAKNRSKVRPIHSAVAADHIDSARAILDAGADANAAQHGGWTAIQAASKRGHVEMVRLLLHHGADPHQEADNGKTAFDFGAEHPEVLALFDDSRGS